MPIKRRWIRPAPAIAADGMIWAETLRNGSGPRHPSIPVEPGTKPTDHEGVVARTAYTTSHQMTWKEKVSGYLVTKAIAAGVMLVAALMVAMGHSDAQAAVGVIPPMVAGAFLGITGVLLIWDLKQPARFHYLITKGNWSSWLVKGAYMLMAFSAVCGLWWIGGLAENGALLEILAVPAVLGAIGTAGLHRLPVRPVRGPRSLADPAAAAGAPGPGGDRRRRGLCDPRRVRRRARAHRGSLGPPRVACSPPPRSSPSS